MVGGIEQKGKRTHGQQCGICGGKGRKGIYGNRKQKEKTGIKAVQMFLFLKFSETFFV